jgi:hypothetical protein
MTRIVHTNGNTPDPRRWFSVGRSTDAAARRAGEAAADAALTAEDPKLLIAFASPSYDLADVTAGIRARATDVPLIGCSTAGEIATAEAGGGSVVVVAIGGEGFSVKTATAEVSSDPRLAGETLAAQLSTNGSHPHRTLLMLSDALAGDQQEILRGVYGVLGAEVPLVGGCAGDDFAMKATFQVHGDRVLSGCVVAAMLCSEAPIGIGVRHGWQRAGEPMIVTRSANNRVYTLDDRPALDVYLERLNPPREAHEDPDAFSRFALTHPLGLNRRGVEEHVRFVAGADFEDRSLTCIAEVPQGGVVYPMEGDVESVLGATDDACAAAVEQLDGRSPLGFLAFDCAGRRAVLGDDGLADELCRVTGHANGAPVAGFYSYGEIARTRGANGFHNETLVVLALS